MEFVCLAAGKGTRLGELGRYLQKCMYPIGLRPFLELSIDNLMRSGAVDCERDRLTLVVGHHGDQVRAYFGSDYQGLAIGYLEQRELLGTAHALHLAQQTLRPRAPVVAWLADLYVPSELFAAIREHPENDVLTLADGHGGESSDIRVSIEGAYVTRSFHGEGALSDIGLWKLSPEVLAQMLVRRGREYRLLASLQRAIEQGAQVGYLRAAAWLHLGGTVPTPEANVRAVVGRLLALEPIA